jgi:acetylornithine deacetylase/succinyl-diaminopimelate desuccinylase-like protein
MVAAELERETTEVLQRLVQFNTVNPPGNERPAIEYLAGYLKDAGFEVEILAAQDSRPNLVADLRGAGDGPTLGFLGHVDTVLAHPQEWTHDPWSGELADGFLWGRGALDMKSQVAAEVVAGVELARSGWRPGAGHLKLMFVCDEETGGELGAQWLTSEHPDRVRCEMLLNEGGGLAFEYEGRRRYGVCCGEKGVFRFTITAHGTAGHASMPKTGDNALLKLGPVLEKFAASESSFELTDVASALIERLGGDPGDPREALARIAEVNPLLPIVLEPMLGVTLTPTMAHASDKVNVIPSRAEIKVDCRVPPGLGEDTARRKIEQVLGAGGEALEIEFNETVVGNQSPPDTPMMRAIERWLASVDPDAEAVPTLLPGFSDSRWFRDAFPDCTAYGFFPHRNMSLFDAAPLVHNADERIDLRDLGFASGFYADIARELLG